MEPGDGWLRPSSYQECTITHNHQDHVLIRAQPAAASNAYR